MTYQITITRYDPNPDYKPPTEYELRHMPYQANVQPQEFERQILRMVVTEAQLEAIKTAALGLAK